jgi:hypothetical protein
MFEARMANVGILKKLVDAIKDLLTEATWDVGENGLALQVIKKALFVFKLLKKFCFLPVMKSCDGTSSSTLFSL